VHFIPEKNVVIVCDTYNHKIKVVDPFRNESYSWLGGSHSTSVSIRDGQTSESAFNEPQGASSMYDE